MIRLPRLPLAKGTAEVTDHVTPQVTPQVSALLAKAYGEMARQELMETLGLKDRKSFGDIRRTIIDAVYCLEVRPRRRLGTFGFAVFSGS